MAKIVNLILNDIYLYIGIIVFLIIITVILIIVSSNRKNRAKIKDDFVQAEMLEEEVEKEKDNPSNELETILQKMQAEMDVKPEDVVKKFEQEQEEKAIISYQELVDNVKSGKIEVIDDEDTGTDFVESLVSDYSKEPISTIEEVDNSSVTPEMVKEAIETISTESVKEEPKKFKQSEFISPIFGIMENKMEYPTVKKSSNMLDIMNTRDYNELTEEIKRQEEFLNALKEFRNNL